MNYNQDYENQLLKLIKNVGEKSRYNLPMNILDVVFKDKDLIKILCYHCAETKQTLQDFIYETLRIELSKVRPEYRRSLFKRVSQRVSYEHEFQYAKHIMREKDVMYCDTFDHDKNRYYHDN